ncbi:unnamed protein product [Medioppia subpectinata]|uniref:Inosine/uridine-preferring nucleoside hydrolase domain-containing protein n=1 Tax=Medioppia subpectinata TaxID=1979941 RepID=A0A7R9KDM0_9ACAR|nr:unnamed protein product [Medioppia subpectinata]CAG2100320.1 unnamed protein product [Medioppia subpectinata]
MCKCTDNYIKLTYDNSVYLGKDLALAVCKASKPMVIIDTDSGVDDALAIMLATYCHKHNMIDIMAITCQFGNTYVDNVVKNVGYTLNATNTEGIKIYRGSDGPLVGKYVASDHFGTDGLGNSTKDMPPISVHTESEHAVNALVRLAREHPKQITLYALGPLTNIALAYMLDNNFFDNLKQIVFMGGVLDFDGNVGPVTEFNVVEDVEACHRVLSSAKCPIIGVPMETGLSNRLTWITDMNYKLVKAEPGSKGLAMYDILAVMAPIYEDYIESKVEYKTSIELNGGLTRGELVFDKRSTPDVLKNDWKSVQYIKHFNQTLPFDSNESITRRNGSKKVDTDCGVDDAMAIMLATYCHKHNMIDIMAITCVFANTYVDNVCKNVGYTLRASDMEAIKIYRGCEGPIVGQYKPTHHSGADGLGDSTKDMPPIDVHIESEHAANALVRLAREHPKQITVIVLGAFTNIALAYMLDNNFFDNLKDIVFMGGTLDFAGNYPSPLTEFNIVNDVEACHIVLSNAKCPIVGVPLECCRSHPLTWDIYDQIVKLDSKKSKFMKQITDMVCKKVKLDPESKVEYKTSIELNGGLTRGELVFDKRSTPDVLKNDWISVQYIQHFNDTKDFNQATIILIADELIESIVQTVGAFIHPLVHRLQSAKSYVRTEYFRKNRRLFPTVVTADQFQPLHHKRQSSDKPPQTLAMISHLFAQLQHQLAVSIGTVCVLVATFGPVFGRQTVSPEAVQRRHILRQLLIVFDVEDLLDPFNERQIHLNLVLCQLVCDHI